MFFGKSRSFKGMFVFVAVMMFMAFVPAVALADTPDLPKPYPSTGRQYWFVERMNLQNVPFSFFAFDLDDGYEPRYYCSGPRICIVGYNPFTGENSVLARKNVIHLDKWSYVNGRWQGPTRWTIDAVSILNTSSRIVDSNFVIRDVHGEIVFIPSQSGTQSSTSNTISEFPPGTVTITPPEETTTTLDFTPLIITFRNITQKFPFSIPWDVKRIIDFFNVEPREPVFTISLPCYPFTGTMQEYTIDLSLFDGRVIYFIRLFELILFDVCLIMIARRLANPEGGD